MVCTIFSHSPVYRIGGDEFIIILENSDFDNINSLVNQFIDEMHKMSADKKLKPWERVSAAIGIAYYDPSIGNDNIDSIFKKADAEMYTMKKRMKILSKFDTITVQGVHSDTRIRGATRAKPPKN